MKRVIGLFAAMLIFLCRRGPSIPGAAVIREEAGILLRGGWSGTASSPPPHEESRRTFSDAPGHPDAPEVREGCTWLTT